MENQNKSAVQGRRNRLHPPLGQGTRTITSPIRIPRLAEGSGWLTKTMKSCPLRRKSSAMTNRSPWSVPSAPPPRDASKASAWPVFSVTRRLHRPSWSLRKPEPLPGHFGLPVMVLNTVLPRKCPILEMETVGMVITPDPIKMTVCLPGEIVMTTTMAVMETI